MPPAVQESARPATTADLERLDELHRGALAQLGEERDGPLHLVREARATPAHDSLAPLLEDPTALVLVGEVDGVAVGYLVGRLVPGRDGGLLGVVDDLFVEDGGRGVGVGEVLIGAAKDWARNAGAFGMDATALPGARETKNFFEANGFKARLITVHTRL